MPVFSDECYVEFTWDGPGRSILEHGLDGVVAVHSLSKRSNLAGGRIGFYAGDPELVHYLQEVRKHVGMMVPGPGPGGRRRRPRRRRPRRACSATATAAGWSGWPRSSAPGRAEPIPLPAGGFYLWFPVGDGWAFTERLAAEGGAIVSPGEFYGAAADHVRVAVVQPDERIELVAERLGV